MLLRIYTNEGLEETQPFPVDNWVELFDSVS